jgi:uncharacterized protein (TIGR02147 family)
MNTELTFTPAHPIELLRTVYLSRKKTNARYSISAFARDLGLSISFLSRLLRGERSLTVNQAIQIGTLLGLSSEQIDQSLSLLVAQAKGNSKISKKFISAIQKKDSRVRNRSESLTYFEVERFKAISEWYHLGILNLTVTKNFDPRPSVIAKRLGISTIEATDAIHRLLQLGLLEKKPGTLKRTSESLYIKTRQSEQAVRKFTVQTMKRAEALLENSSPESFQQRCMPGSTLPIDSKKLPLLKERLLKFQLEFAELAKSDQCDEVYQFNLQLFPLSQTMIETNLPKTPEKKT